MATIKAIEDRTVHQIQSGQVIVDLCSVVKELVENSLDAGATSIDVRFKNQGLEAIEVQDNGDGISSHNYETIALKHYTSKLSTYSDLTTLQTFGFRGEALSSLCALSNFSIITCTAGDAPKGTKLEFEVSGKLKGTGVVAAQKGTTVTVENLFNNLPVRRRELERNIKREWNRVVGVLGQYACIQTGIKFSVSQQAAKGKKTTLFSTKGNQSTRDNIVNVFGAKTLPALIPMDLKLELEPTSGPSQRWSTLEDGGKKDIRIVGHISRPAFGEGRLTPDRQMFFVNTRPCGLPQVAKAFNEVYKAYNSSQSPFIFANIELDTHLYDVNVSPDKRTILLHDQGRMLENMKVALTELFETQDYTVPISQLPAQKQPLYKQLTISRESTIRTPTPQSRADSTEGEESEDRSRDSRSESVEEGNLRSRKSSNSEVQRSAGSAVSRASLSRDSQAVNLISNWVGRKSEDRSERAVSPATNNAQAKNAFEGLSKDKRALIEKLKRDGKSLQAESEASEEPHSSTDSTESSLAVPSVRPSVLTSSDSSETQSPEVSENNKVEKEEARIPALSSPSKLSSNVLNTFSSSRRPQSTAELATITIGDHVVTSSIVTPASKRARINDHFASASPGRPSQTTHINPSFGSLLSQRFAAPGTQRPTLDGDEVELTAASRVKSDDEDADLDEEDENPAFETVPASGQSITENEVDEDDQDGEYIDDDEKKKQEDAKVQEMIREAEAYSKQPSQENALRAKALIRGGSKKKDATLNLVRTFTTSTSRIGQEAQLLGDAVKSHTRTSIVPVEDEGLDSDRAEEKLSLTILKSDFARMKIIGQFNLGFILASRTATREAEDGTHVGDELFIIDQHASDEKYNFERLQATTIVQSQRLVYPKTLDLTAMEEEIVLENLPALETNGFIVTVDETGEAPVGQRCQLVSLPLSKETAFSIKDLEELLVLLAESPPGSLPRPSKVRKMFAMRACRSSVMIGRTLTKPQMGKLVSHLGELDKPWNCPHGRPTMRHLCGLNAWDALGWKEGDTVDGEKAEPTDWAGYVRRNKDDSVDAGSDIASDIASEEGSQ